VEEKISGSETTGEPLPNYEIFFSRERTQKSAKNFPRRADLSRRNHVKAEAREGGMGT
jgi:hypothetical protein